jgi:hypothetical protein
MNQAIRCPRIYLWTVFSASLYLLIPACVSAQEIYKTINEDGSVEYTTIPPSSGSKVVTLTPGAEPTEAEIQAAQDELQRLRDSLEERSRDEDESESSDAGDSAGDNPQDEQPAVNPLPALAPFL